MAFFFSRKQEDGNSAAVKAVMKQVNLLSTRPNTPAVGHPPRV